MAIIKVAVGSTNKAKIEAVRLAFETLWPTQHWDVEGIRVDSGVSDQPRSDSETIAGARNRSKSALTQLKAAYGVGLEGGLQQVGDWWFESGWIVVVDNSGCEGIGSTIKMAIPHKMMELIEQGRELSDVDDIFFNKQGGNKVNGHYGLMTKNALTRTSSYRDGVVSALIRFIHPNLFEDAQVENDNF